ncbi:1679_t:CDS:10 [Ambispora gerdemannii]|uniref:1679_t:CDS:1 n=1 Tax=Ambispora gerdemannii TaxID=144530 RepID=A0A9N9C968_9GLOM|nr:1679_t:CDS:10 [Ambispora gerdemannii]
MSATDQEITDFVFETPAASEENEANVNTNEISNAPVTAKNIQALKAQIIEIDQLFNLFALKESELSDARAQLGVLGESLLSELAANAIKDTEITQKNQEITQKDQEIIQKNQDIASLRAGLTKLRDQVSIPVQDCERLRKEVKSLNIKLEEKETRLQEHGNIIGDAQRLRSDNQNLMSRVRSLEALKSQLEFKIQENENNASNNDQIKKEHQKLKKDLAKKEDKCNKSNAEKLALEERIKQIEAEKNLLEERVKDLESEIEKRQDEDLERELNQGLGQECLAEKDSKIAELDEELGVLRNEAKMFDQIRSECEKLRRENQQLKISEKSQTQEADQQNEILKLKRELAELKNVRQNNHDIEQQLKTSNDEIEKLRQILRDKPKETLNIHPDISNQFSLVMQELNASKKNIENLEKVKIALQDLVTTQQIQIMDLRNSKQAVISTVSSSAIQETPNKDPLTPTYSNSDLIDPTHPNSGLIDTVLPTHSKSGLIDPIPPTHSNPGLIDPTHPNPGLIDPVLPTHSNSGLIDPIPPTHSNPGLIDPVLPTHSNPGLIDAVPPIRSNPDLIDPVPPTHSNPGLIDPVLPILEDTRKKRKNFERELGDNNAFALTKPDPKKRRVTRQKTIPSISNSTVGQDQLSFIAKKLQDLAGHSENVFNSIKSLRSFAFEKGETLIQAIDQYIRLLRTPHNLKPIGEVDQVKNIVDLKGRSIPMPVVLPKREADFVLFLWFMSREFPDSNIIEKIMEYAFKQIVLSKNKSNDMGIGCRLCRIFVALCRISRDIHRPRTLCFDLMREIHKFDYVVKIVENIAKIWPQVLHNDVSSNSQENVTILGTMESIIAQNIKDSSLYSTFVRYCSWNQLSNIPSLQDRLQALSDLIQSPEFQVKCRAEADNGQFQEYRYNLIKSFELIACWSPWPEFYEKVVCGVLLPLVGNEDLAGVPIEIIGEVCRKGILDVKKKKEVSEMVARLCQNLAPQNEASLIQKARFASVILNLAEGDLEFVDAVFRWHSSLEVQNELPSVFVEQLKVLRSVTSN